MRLLYKVIQETKSKQRAIDEKVVLLGYHRVEQPRSKRDPMRNAEASNKDPNPKRHANATLCYTTAFFLRLIMQVNWGSI
jgi:hypothetical protein